MSYAHHQVVCLAPSAAVLLSPLDLPYLFTQNGEVLCELNHQDDEGPSCEHAGGPEERVEDGAVAIHPGQEDTLLLLTGVVVAGNLLVYLQALRDVHYHSMHDHAVLLALGYIETLKG